MSIAVMNVTFMAAFATWVLYARERLGLGDVGFGLLITDSPIVAIATVVVFGVHTVVWGAASTTVRQRAVPEHLLGRVTSVYLLASVGGAAIGATLGGLLSQTLGLDRDAMESARAETERTRDEALPEDTRSRPNRGRSRVHSVRLSEEEHGAVKALAAEQGIPTSTLIRSWIVERLRARSDDSLETRVERLERLVMPRGPAW